jgi:hypothetical protein
METSLCILRPLVAKGIIILNFHFVQLIIYLQYCTQSLIMKAKITAFKKITDPFVAIKLLKKEKNVIVVMISKSVVKCVVIPEKSNHSEHWILTQRHAIEGHHSNVRHQKVCVVRRRVNSRHPPNYADTNPNAISSHFVTAIMLIVLDLRPNQTRLNVMAEHKFVGAANVSDRYVRNTTSKNAF